VPQFLYKNKKVEVKSLSEAELRQVLVSQYRAKGWKAEDVHGVFEFGVDIIASIDRKTDYLEKNVLLLVQVKKGSISLSRWLKIANQILQLMWAQIPHENFDPRIAKRVLLVFSGKLSEAARRSIWDFNRQWPIAVETFDIDDLSDFLGIGHE
jgi:hypothetical protein